VQDMAVIKWVFCTWQSIYTFFFILALQVQLFSWRNDCCSQWTHRWTVAWPGAFPAHPVRLAPCWQIPFYSYIIVVKSWNWVTMFEKFYTVHKATRGRRLYPHRISSMRWPRSTLRPTLVGCFPEDTTSASMALREGMSVACAWRPLKSLQGLG
jgi:hypothetical protein